MAKKTGIEKQGLQEQEESDPNYGHRARLRARFLRSGGDALADYELLELLLCQAQPRRDMKPLAKTLLKHFGSIAGVINADANELKKIKGVGVSVIATFKLATEIATQLIKAEVADKPILSNWHRLTDYCRLKLARSPIECLHILFLNARNELIADEEQQHGTVDHTPIYPREVAKRALELHASAIIMVHNHPSGDHNPSKEDIAMTKQLRDVASGLGIALHDHLIVSRNGFTSFKDMGIL